jgi:hypothetical protein
VGDVHLESLAGDERQLVLEGEVAHVQHRQRELAPEVTEGDRPAPSGHLRRQDRQDLWRNGAQFLHVGEGNVQLLGESAQELALVEAVRLQQAGTEPPSEQPLLRERASELLGRDPSAIEEELAESLNSGTAGCVVTVT